jgi:glucokinase
MFDAAPTGIWRPGALDHGSYLGVDVGGTRMKWSVLAGESVLADGAIDTPLLGRPAVLDAIVGLQQRYAPRAVGLGIAVPGVVDVLRRETLLVPNLPGDWERVPIGAELEGRCGVPVSLLNDARAFGYAELLWGAGRGRSNVLFVTLGTGVGGAIALGGRIVMGVVDSLGEFGHQVVAPDGDRCGCGGHGCLETVASATAIVRYAVREAVPKQSTGLTKLTGGHTERLTAELVAQAADDGDPSAVAAFERAGRAVGMAALSACLLLQIKTVVVGGGLSGAFRHIAPAAKRILGERLALTGTIAFREAELGPRAGAVGAAIFASHSGRPQLRAVDIPVFDIERTPTP